MLAQTASAAPAASLSIDPRSFEGAHPLTVVFVLLGTLALGLLIASVYKWTHRGLSYSQAFQFGRLGYGAAISYALLILVSIVALIQLRIVASDETYGESNVS